MEFSAQNVMTYVSLQSFLAEDEIIANYITREIYINVRRHGAVVETCLFNSVLYFLFSSHHVKCGIYTQSAPSVYAWFVEGLSP